MIDPLILARSVHIAASVLACGTVCFVVLVADVPALRRRMNATIWIALALAIVSGAVWLVLLASQIFGASIVEVCLHGGVWQVASGTRFGLVWTARLILALALGLLLLWPAARLLQIVAAVLLIALLGLIGHAGATPGVAGAVHLASDMVHLVAAGVWLGGLPALVMLLAQARRSRKRTWRAVVTDATERFSLLGIVCVAALLASGTINSWNLLSGPRDLLATGYGQLVLLKIGLFIAMVCIAAVSRYRLTPRLPARTAMHALQRNAFGETALGVCVLVVVGVLGNLAPTAHVHTSSADIPPGAAFVHIHDVEVLADVTIDPGRAGRAKAIIRVSREDLAEFAAKDVKLELNLPSAGLKTKARATLRMPDGTWQADDIEIPQRGIWTVRVIVTPQAGQRIVLDAPIVIE